MSKIVQLQGIKDQIIGMMNQVESLMMEEEEVVEAVEAQKATDEKVCKLRLKDGSIVEDKIGNIKDRLEHLGDAVGNPEGWNVEWDSGERFWVKNGLLESIDGHYSAYYPQGGGQYQWHMSGNLHNEAGPAVTFEMDDKVQYYLNKQRLDKLQWEKATGRAQMSLDDIPTEDLMRALAENMGLKVKDVVRISNRRAGKPGLSVVKDEEGKK